MLKSDFDKKTLNLREGDWDYLESIYKPNGISTSLVVRTLVSKHVDQLRSKASEESVNMEVDL